MVDYEQRLRTLLKKLFQFDQADLDFGIYRIINQKRDEINNFIEKELIETIGKAFEEYSAASKKDFEKELNDTRKKIIDSFGENAILPNGDIKQEYHGTPLSQSYYKKKKSLDEITASEDTKADIFNHIYQFFSCYYQDGDFISRRKRSKDEKYAVPYNGEEVILHWANKDQYYIKTTEYFNNYAFEAGEYRILFKVVAIDNEQNNNQGDKRYFFLSSPENNFVFDEKNKLFIMFFEYRKPSEEEDRGLGGKQNKQEIINEKTHEIICEKIEDKNLVNLLNKEENNNILLLHHLNKYAKQNTYDYFIHKDLEGFLKRELDFYVKNEIYNVDDLISLAEKDFNQQIALIKSFKKISISIISFLGQIENFQRLLWEKKKLVIRTEYCMTLDKVPEKFYDEILENKNQISEWHKIFKLKEFEKKIDPLNFSSNDGLNVDIDYLKSHQFLVLDTVFFSQNFKDRLLETFDNLEEELGGLLVKSENWQALNFLQAKYSNKIKCCYIDPPYNTGNDEFIYRDNYKHSSWLSMFFQSLEKNIMLLKENGMLFTSIDDNECYNLRHIMDSLFGPENFKGEIVRATGTPTAQGTDNLANEIDYILVYSKGKESIFQGLPFSETDKERYNKTDEKGKFLIRPLRKTGAEDRREDRPNMYYEVQAPDGTTVLPIGPTGYESRWRVKKERYNEMVRDNLIHWEKVQAGDVEEWRVYIKFYLEGRLKRPSNLWTDIEGNKKAQIEIRNLFNEKLFSNPKPTDLVSRCILISSNMDDIILDYFAGSGTTAHAVLNLNRENDRNHKYILVDMAAYFDTIIKPRIKKLVFTKDWKNGYPQNSNGISHMFKYLYLEQYEDTLNNIEFVLPDGTTQKTLFDLDDFFLRYMLEFESRGSSCRLNVDNLTKPFDYTMRIVENGELKEKVPVDLVETFNYLLGLHVEKIMAYENDDRRYRVVLGHIEDERVVVVWRDAEDFDESSLIIDKEFIEKKVLEGIEFHKLYVNGKCFVKKSSPIEPKFKVLMGA